MGCEALPIEYYESLAEKGSSSIFLTANPLHKKTPIGDFSNIAILCLRYFNPINEKGGLNLYVFCYNNSISRIDYLGQMAPYGMGNNPSLGGILLQQYNK
jgi:hypothetical protein